MKTQNKTRTLTAVWLLAVTAGLFLTTTSRLPAQEEDYEILLRGPVHEAFAEAVSLDPEPGLIIDTAPPEPIEELPPEHQLEGDNVAWIPGYWIWDDERDDFVWLSGVWRDMPPGRQWVPGYWETLPEGRYQWVAGFWEDAETVEVAYLATAPPKSLETGPNGPRPAANYNWAPGNWVYSDTRYNWRPGQWIDYRDDWTWVPARYYWTPRGYVYVDGYWDHNIGRRGVLFAPVYYRNHDYYRSPSYRYTPSIAVALDIFLDHLFIRPRYNHYYFGDYYEPRYRDSGYYGSYSWHSHRGGYDPIFAHQRWDHRSDRNWDKKRRDRDDYYRDHQEARPLRTWSDVRAHAGKDKDDDHKRSFGTTLDSLAKNPGKDQKFRTTGKEDREKYIQGAKEMRKYQGDRRLAESKPAAAEKDGKDEKGKPAAREKIGRSPMTGRKVEDLPKEKAPPSRPDRDKGRDKDAERPDSPERGQAGKPDKDAPSQKDHDRGKSPADKGPERTERQPDKGKPEAPKPDKARPEAPKPDKARPEAPKPDKARPAPPKQDKAAPERRSPEPTKRQPDPRQEKARPAPPQKAEPEKRERTRQPEKSQPQRERSEPSKEDRKQSDDKDRGKNK